MIENNPKKICTYLKHFAGDLKLTQYCKSTTCVHVSHTQSCLILCDSMDCSPPGSWVHGILQAGILEWEAIPFSRGSSQPMDQIWLSRIAGRFFTVWATREAQINYTSIKNKRIYTPYFEKHISNTPIVCEKRNINIITCPVTKAK